MPGRLEFQGRIQLIEDLVRKLEASHDAEARATAKELVRLLLEIHSAGLERIFKALFESGEAGRSIADSLCGDDVVRSLLLLHGLHPLEFEKRVAKALEKVRPYLRSHGGDVELVAMDGGAVHLRLNGSCHGCPSSEATLRLAIEDALYEAAPDLAGLKVEGVRTPGPPPEGFVPLANLTGQDIIERQDQDHSSWQDTCDVASLPGGVPVVVSVGGQEVLLCGVGQVHYAYANFCPSCKGSLESGRLEGSALTCPGCGTSYNLARAGRGIDKPGLHLQPLPLLVEDGRARVAVPVYNLARD